jgi:hypothetical protein
VAALLAVLLAAGPARAQTMGGSGVPLRRDAAGNGYGPGLDGLRAVTVSQTLVMPICQAPVLIMNLSVPAGTGDELLDRLLETQLYIEARNLWNPLLRGYNSPDDCQELRHGPNEIARTFEAHSPSPGLLSIIYDENASYAGAAHPSQSFRSATYVLGTAVELTSFRLMSQYPVDLKPLWARLARAWCSYNEQRTIPAFYGLRGNRNWCAKPEAAPLPPALSGPDFILDNLGHAYLTVNGMTIQLGPYDAWSYALGPAALSVDKRTLIRLGFKPSLWGR